MSESLALFMFAITQNERVWRISVAMLKDLLKIVVMALVAILLTFMVLLFIATNPWMLAGVAAVLFAIAAIVRAINGGPSDGSDGGSANSDAETPPSPSPTDSAVSVDSPAPEAPE